MDTVNKVKDTINKAKLIERGWTSAGIKKFLGDPDETKQNPFYRVASPMCLYKLERVKDAELKEEFIKFQAKSACRKEKAKQVVLVKKDKLQNIVKTWEPSIKKYPITWVRKAAIEAYNERQLDVMSDKCASLKDDPLFLNRITVNFIRHEITSYDDLLHKLHGKVGKLQAIDMVREKVYECICNNYPDLIEECKRQLEMRKNK